MRQRRVVTALAIPLVFAFVAASCGSDDDSSGDTDTSGTTATEDTTDGEETEGTTPSNAEGEVDTTVVAEEEEATYGGTVTIGLEAEAPGLRPWEDSCSSPCYVMMRSIYDPFMDQSPEGGYAPFLAESLESNEDFTVWTMTLRPGVTFHNGTELTAQTVADMFPIQQAGAAGSGGINAAKLVGVAAIDDLTVEYTLSEPNVSFPAALAGAPVGFPFDPAAAAADPTGYSTSPIGTGPFTIVSRDIDNATVVERNENYWYTDADGNQLPYLDSVEFRPIPDEGTRLDALLSGTVNAMQSLRQGTIRDARAESGIELLEYQGNNTVGGMFNTQVPPFDDQRVRMGLNKMNDQARVIEALGGAGISNPSTQWFSVDSVWWTQEAADSYPEFNFEEGQALIQEYVNDPARSDGKAAGEPIDVELSCPPDPTLIAAMQVLEQVWAGSGLVNVSLTQFDQATHINNAISDAHRAHCWRWGGEGDPAASIHPAVANFEGAPTNNFPNYYDPELEALAQQANATDDFETRKDLYSQIMVEWNNQAIMWYSGSTATMIATAPDVRGILGWEFPDGSLGVGIAPEAQIRWFMVNIAE
jgi:peptide/nickel transport system substrate-binding protein